MREEICREAATANDKILCCAGHDRDVSLRQEFLPPLFCELRMQYGLCNEDQAPPTKQVTSTAKRYTRIDLPPSAPAADQKGVSGETKTKTAKCKTSASLRSSRIKKGASWSENVTLISSLTDSFADVARFCIVQHSVQHSVQCAQRIRAHR